MNANDAERTMDPASGRYRSVVTYLEMRLPAAVARPEPPRAGVEVLRWEKPALDEYLRLFRRIGDPWLWYGRLAEGEAGIARLLAAPEYEIRRLWVDGAVAGLGELDFSQPGEVELAYFGLVPGHIGGGLGGYLLRTLLHEAARPGVERLWLHTCTEDHPDALSVYRHFGFRAYDREVEWVHDPRLRGLLPREAGPHVGIPE